MIENGLSAGLSGLAGRAARGAWPQTTPQAGTTTSSSSSSSSSGGAGANAARAGGAGPAFQFGGSLAALFDGAGGAGGAAGTRSSDAAERLKQSVAAAEEFGNRVQETLDTANERVGQLLAMFGMEDESVKEAKEKLAEKTGSKRTAPAGEGAEGQPAGAMSPFAPPTMPGLDVPGATEAATLERQSSSSRFALQVENIDLTLETGGKKLSVSFERTTAMVESSSESLYAAYAGGPGGSAASLEMSSEHMMMASQEQSLSISFEGGSEEEAAAVRAQLESLIADGGLDALLNGGTPPMGGPPPEGGPPRGGAAGGAPPALARIRPAPAGEGSETQGAGDGSGKAGLAGFQKFIMDLAVPILRPGADDADKAAAAGAATGAGAPNGSRGQLDIRA